MNYYEAMKTRQELKAEYKQRKPEAGVFQVLNEGNGKMLIEGATNISSKWNRHRTELRFGSHRNKALQADWITFGEDKFSYSVLSELKVDDAENIDYQEEVQLLLELLDEELDIPKNLRY